MKTNAIKERPILFSAPMVRATIERRKTQTRRIVKPQPSPMHSAEEGDVVLCPVNGISRIRASRGRNAGARGRLNLHQISPYGLPGDRLWVRERLSWRRNEGQITHGIQHPPEPPDLVYEADDAPVLGAPEGWSKSPVRDIPSIHMPRWASRLTLEILSVRVERVQAISEEDAAAEGMTWFTKDGKFKKWWPCDPCDGPVKCAWQDLPHTAAGAFAALWHTINGPDSWAANPWVWVISFKVVK